MDNFILDFYCPEIRLAIEMDGGQHITNKEQDNMRTKELNRKNITVIRFTNDEVLNDLDSVLEEILRSCP